MRLHTDCIEMADLFTVAREVGVGFQEDGPTRHGSRKRDHAFEVKLTGSSRHRPNVRYRSDEYAATWDEWGMLMVRLYGIDPLAVWGRNDYAYWEHFHWATGQRFLHLQRSEQHIQHKWTLAFRDHLSYEYHCEGSKAYGSCSAIMRRLAYGVSADEAMSQLGLLSM